MTQIFYEEVSGQVMAVYEGCTYSGDVWQSAGYSEAVSSIPVTRDSKVVVTAGVVTAVEASINPVQAAPPPTLTPAELAALYVKANTELVGIVGFLVRQVFEMQNRLSGLDGGTQFPASVAGAQQWLDYVNTLPALPDSKIEKLIETVS
jgi:hypothetical protein